MRSCQSLLWILEMLVLPPGNRSHGGTHALPRPFPAPVTMATRPLTEIFPLPCARRSDIFSHNCE